MSSVLESGKSQREPMVVEARLQFCFWPKTLAQASMCELVRYHGAKFMIAFFTILCVSEESLLAVGAYV